MPLYRFGGSVTSLVYVEHEFDSDEEAEAYADGEIGDFEDDLWAADPYDYSDAEIFAILRQDGESANPDEDGWVEV